MKGMTSQSQLAVYIVRILSIPILVLLIGMMLNGTLINTTTFNLAFKKCYKTLKDLKVLLLKEGSTVVIQFSCFVEAVKPSPTLKL